jgi:hypothetical protein
VASEDRNDWVRKSRGKVLWRMHKQKLDLWEDMLNNCPMYGAKLTEGSHVTWNSRGPCVSVQRRGVVILVIPSGIEAFKVALAKWKGEKHLKIRPGLFRS